LDVDDHDRVKLSRKKAMENTKEEASTEAEAAS